MNSDKQKCQEISAAKLVEPEKAKVLPRNENLLCQTFGLNATQSQNLTLSNVILGSF